MTDLAERLLRDVLTEDAGLAPPPRDLARAARGRLRRRRAGVAGVAAALVAVAGGVGVATYDRGTGTGVVTSPAPPAGPPPLAGTQWELVEVVEGGRRRAVEPGALLLRITGDRVSVRKCNSEAGDVEITPGYVEFGPRGHDDVHCPGDRGTVDDALDRLGPGRVAWQVAADRLTLTGGSGTVLTFRVYRSPYPVTEAVTFDVGERSGREWRLGYGTAPGEEGSLVFEWRPQGGAWRVEQVRPPAPGEPVLSELLVADLGDDLVFVGGFATPDTVGAALLTGVPPRSLLVYRPEGAGRRYFGGFVTAAWADYVLELSRGDGRVVARRPG